MKSKAVSAFFRLIRWPNLIFISLTQSLFYFCIIIPSFYQAHPVHENILQWNVFIGPSNICCVLLLWFYSTTFKKKLLIGNILISLLTAWVIGVLYLAEF